MNRKRDLGGKKSTAVGKNLAHIGVNTVVDYGNMEYEMRCVLYNLGAAHSRLAAAQDRSPPIKPIGEGAEPSNQALKIACTHLQYAAWAFEVFLHSILLLIYQLILII